MGGMRVNIACGNSYVDGWHNLDYAPQSPSVVKANLLSRLPIADGQAEVVYSSHFLEHIPRARVSDFLAECYRIMAPGGRIRLVLPDLEEMCRTYLMLRGSGQNEKADFEVLQMFDQCVRMVSGGELQKFYDAVGEEKDKKREMIEFIQHRTGEVLFAQKGSDQPLWRTAFFPNIQRIRRMLEKIYIQLIVMLLPRAFRQANVSHATVGERHAWMYDFFTVEQLLGKAGFIDIRRESAKSSDIEDFPLAPLDLYEDGSPRKGADSMYIEARKP